MKIVRKKNQFKDLKKKKLLQYLLHMILACLSPLTTKYFTKNSSKKKKKQIKLKKKNNFFLLNRKKAKLIMQPKEKVICVLNTRDFVHRYAVCEGSIVYFLDLKIPKKSFVIECLLNKGINLGFFDTQKKLQMFSSLYNKNKKDDKIYYLNEKGNRVEELVIDITPSDTRIVNISASCGNGIFFHLGFLIFLKFCFVFYFIKFID